MIPPEKFSDILSKHLPTEITKVQKHNKYLLFDVNCDLMNIIDDEIELLKTIYTKYSSSTQRKFDSELNVKNLSLREFLILLQDFNIAIKGNLLQNKSKIVNLYIIAPFEPQLYLKL